ncbi:DUF3290 domain-containing protein [Enterococcus faecalis]|jgi:hypothetical protein|uniref:DUF3290 domain-containing protein n=1 Tax=Enterococcus faecalis ATCC 6055 TaxID=1169311 RepID=R3K2V5_ENTFL|nr:MULTISPECIES: DUF3290 domain-containing protein [Enterococcus]EGO6720010.1 DUF3290 domain-containing protein [Enterococcus faecalis]EGO8122264.1 DUF3290 domain-containing protein [Enterococcus faecalis]EGO8848191.1 DUF3290 domain-containing protein [Enterococcus faecalis]EGO9003043.1 DUF3290 domain-containing protein [Enterococcus faecalis]EHB5085142.1 DUF3290 domain-containing protein [Enterococcus faecalis]
MNFYGINYLESQSDINDYLRYFLIFGSLFLLVIVFILYLRHRIKTKYRDLSIIFLLLLIFASGVQYSDYQSNQAKHTQSSQMVNLVQNLAKEKKIDESDIFVNSTQLVDGIMIKIKKNYFRVNLSSDQSSFTLEKAYLINQNIVLNK